MRNLLVIGMFVLAAFMAGWFQVNRDGDTTTIHIDRSEIRQDTRKVIDRGRELLDEREQERREAEARQQAWLQGEVTVPPQWLGQQEGSTEQPAARLEWAWPRQQPQ